MENESASTESTPEEKESVAANNRTSTPTEEVINSASSAREELTSGESLLPNSTTTVGSSGDAPQSSSTSGGDSKSKDKDRDKINILLKPVGDAPILKNKLWSVPSERLVSQITEFVKKYLKLEKNQNLFFFVNQLFAPAPDQCLRDLYECFGSDGKLVLHYSTTVAWG